MDFTGVGAGARVEAGASLSNAALALALPKKPGSYGSGSGLDSLRNT